MRKLVYVLLFFLIVSFSCFPILRAGAKVPDWVRELDYSQKYPPKLYLAAFGLCNGSDPEASRIAQDNARAEVSRSIIVNVKSLLSTVKEEVNEEYSQHFSSITLSSTSIQLMGLQTEQYVDDSPSEPMIYALAYASRADLRRIYSEKRDNLINQIERVITSAQEDEKNSKIMDAVTKYSRLYPIYEELKEAEVILLVVNQSGSIENAFESIAEEGSDKKPMMSQIDVANKIDQLLSQSLNSVDDVARSVVFRLSNQVGELKGRILVTPFTYQDTKMGSSFARYFRSELENQLVQMANWNVADQAQAFKPKTAQITRDLVEESGAERLLSGTYWEKGDKIKLIASMRDVNSGKVLAGTDLSFDASILPENLRLKPQNYETALIQQEEFSQGELVSSQLQVEVWTNKGSEDLIYTEGETMKVYIRVNRESYVRLLYTLADGRWTLLYDNLYVDRSKVNRVVEIPEEFECAPPFGAEMLVVIARTEEFNPTNVLEEDGYYFLNMRSVSEVRSARGMKVKKRQNFSTATDFQGELDNQRITDSLRAEFEKSNFSLSQNATVSVQIPGSEWLITDLSNLQTYLIRKEEGKLNIYRIQQAEARVVITTMEK